MLKLEIQNSWPLNPTLDGPSGLEFEAPDLSGKLGTWSYVELAKELERYSVYYLFCHFTIEYARYYVASYMLYGLDTWLARVDSLELTSLEIADNIYYFLSGRRWPVEVVVCGLSKEQVQTIVRFLDCSMDHLDELSLSPMTIEKLHENLTVWKEIASALNE